MTWRVRAEATAIILRVGASLLVVLLASACAAPPRLRPGDSLESRIAPEEKVDYRILLTPDWRARVEVHPASEAPGSGGVLDVTVFDPRGDRILEASRIVDPEGGVLAWVTDREGDYRLQVSNPSVVEEVGYRLSLLAHPATAADRHRAEAETAQSLAARHEDGHDLSSATEVLEKAGRLWQLAGEIEKTIEAHLGTAGLYEDKGELNAALGSCEKALEVARRNGFPHRSVDASNCKGRVLRKTGDCEGAREAYESALALAERDGLADGAALSAFNLAVLYGSRSCSRPREVGPAYERALALARSAGDRITEGYSHRSLALLARERGDRAAALHHIEHARAAAAKVSDLQLQAVVAFESGRLEASQGELEAAVEHYRQALATCRAGSVTAGEFDSLITLGTISLALRQPEQARRYLEQAIALAESLGEPSRLSKAERELGGVFEWLGELDLAERHYRRSLEAAEKLDGAARDPALAPALYRLGTLAVTRGRPEDAVESLEQALELRRALDDRRGLALTYRSLGSALGRIGRSAEALVYLSNALELDRADGDRLRQLWTLYRFAQEEVRAGSPASAERHIYEAIAINRRLRDRMGEDRLKTGFSTGGRKLSELLVHLLMSSERQEAAFDATEQSRAQALLDLLAASRVDRSRDAPRLGEEIRAAEAELSWLQNLLNDMVASRGDRARIAEIQSRIEAAEARWRRLDAKARSPSGRVSSRSEVTLGEVQRMLSPRQALLAYWLSDDASYLFVVTRERFSGLRLHAGEEEIDAHVAAVRDAVLTDPRSFALPAHWLFERLVAPALPVLDGKPDLIVVPDGTLHRLPFEALVTELSSAPRRFGDLRYLVHRGSISYVPSATVLASLGSQSRRSESLGPSLVAFADPLYDEPLALNCPRDAADSGQGPARGLRGRSFQRLPATRTEVEAIARVVHDRPRLFLGRQASETAVKQRREVSEAERLHFAVHGVVCETLPERSGLVMTLGRPSSEDGFVQMREIYGLDLSADLVVLSACDTGLGQTVAGEGVVGFARAFLDAGASSVVVSLWQVSDRSTAELMTRFYRELGTRSDKAEALRRAQIAMIRSGKRWAAPFYWAPFVLVGERGGSAGSKQSRSGNEHNPESTETTVSSSLGSARSSK